MQKDTIEAYFNTHIYTQTLNMLLYVFTDVSKV